MASGRRLPSGQPRAPRFSPVRFNPAVVEAARLALTEPLPPRTPEQLLAEREQLHVEADGEAQPSLPLRMSTE